MKNKSSEKYKISDLEEAQFESGSRGRVLKNLLSIKRKREMNLLEWEHLLKVSDKFVDTYEIDHQFSSNDICDMHKAWLKPIYKWAGEYRNVNMSKDDFHFAAAHLIPKLMQDFENIELKRYTPCCFSSMDEVITSIAVVHTEFILIHPFREGNGRLGRMLSALMALQFGLPMLDFGGIKGRKKQEYFAAVRAGLDRNYLPMEKIFKYVVDRTIRLYKDE